MKTTAHRVHACLTAFLIAVIFSSCATKKSPVRDPAVRLHRDLAGRSLAAAFERFGRHTIVDRTSRASELGGEFYTPINAHFPPGDPASRRVFIREVRWRHGDRYIAALCTRQHGEWVVFDVIEWHKSIQF